ncbi:MAG: transposase, partial [Siphonobacter aquaeclarae]|nr:transposase [Siphonobacter aquaeclarae]
GQLSLADSLVPVEETILDQLSSVVDWRPIRDLLGRRSGPGSGNTSYPAEVLLRCLLLGVWHGLSDPALEAQVRDRLSFRRFAGFQKAGNKREHAGRKGLVMCEDNAFFCLDEHRDDRRRIIPENIPAGFVRAAQPPAFVDHSRNQFPAAFSAVFHKLFSEGKAGWMYITLPAFPPFSATIVRRRQKEAAVRNDVLQWPTFFDASGTSHVQLNCLCLSG